MQNPAPVIQFTSVSYSERQRGVSSKLRIFDTLVLRYRRISDNAYLPGTWVNKSRKREGRSSMPRPFINPGCYSPSTFRLYFSLSSGIHSEWKC